MLGDVAQSLLDEAVDRGLQLAIQRILVQSYIEMHLEPFDLVRPAREALERSGQTELIECRRTQLGDQGAQVRNLGRQVLRRLPRRTLERLAARPQPRREQHAERGETLQRLVVQLACP